MSLIEKAIAFSSSGKGKPPNSTEPEAFDLDYGKLAQHGLYHPDASDAELGRDLRILRRRLLHRLGFAHGAKTLRTSRRRRNVVMITSSAAGEGATFTATNLALSLALEDSIEAFLVEASIQAPRLVEHLGLPEGPGLAEWLDAPAAGASIEIASLSRRARQAPLKVLPAGGPAIAAEQRKDLAVELAASTPEGVVFIDAPPISNAASARRLAQYADEILVVVAADETRKPVLVAAIDELVDINPNISLVLNRRVIRAERLDLTANRHNDPYCATGGPSHNLRQGGAFQ